MAVSIKRLKEKKRGAELRTEIRSYIRNERNTIATQWLAFKENVKAEDRRREQFLKESIKETNHVIPESIQKFIGSLKRAVRKTMRAKGGTCASIIKEMFLYWDADRSGTISMGEMKAILRSLAIITTPEEDQEIMNYYSSSEVAQEVVYTDLLEDIQRGEPSIISFVNEAEEHLRTEKEKYFEEIGAAKHVPPLVQQFIEVLQEYIATKMRNEGGTPYSVCHDLFQKYDYDYSNGLNPQELQTACVRSMKMTISLDQAAEIVKFYDKRRNNELEFDFFFPHISHGTQPLLHFVVKTPRTLDKIRQNLNKNPLIPKPFRAASNKTLEKFKLDVKNSLRNRIKSSGGSMKSWVTEAFGSWDPKGVKTLSSIDHIIGAVNRLGVEGTEELAKVLLKSYDLNDNGQMHYLILLDELCADDAHFMTDTMMTSRREAEAASLANSSATARVPPMANACIAKFRASIDAFVRKSKGHLLPKDLLHGTFLRFDPNRTGRLNVDDVSKVCHELRVSIPDKNELQSLVTWFDTDGSRSLDYNAFVRELYGDDITTVKLVLPKLSSGELALLSTSATMKSLPGSFILKKSDEKLDMTRDRNMQPIESNAVILARNANIKKKILSERAKVERKLQSIEEQRKKVVEEFKSKHHKNKASEATATSLTMKNVAALA
jgi:Ca2+-binding EF-hand superfamily protein